MNELSSGNLYIVSTPIGNLDDITLRGIETLKNSDIILCEDTRHSIKLLNHLNIKKKLISYHKFNEKKQISTVIQHINKGKTMSIISDAGTPLLSDPGISLVKECIKKNIKVIPIPGVSSITAAMSVSGFSDQFLFIGFLPKKDGELDKLLSSFTNFRYSIVFFIPASKINFYLKKFKIFFSGRKIMIAKEMTKIHEEIFRGNLRDFQLFKDSIKGELTVIISENELKTKELDSSKIKPKIKKYLKKYSLKDTVDLIFETEGVSKKEIYKLCLKEKNEKNY